MSFWSLDGHCLDHWGMSETAAPTPALNRQHWSLSFHELGQRLGLSGDVFHVWREDAVDYLHLLVYVPEAEPTERGGYTDEQSLPPRTIVTVTP